MYHWQGAATLAPVHCCLRIYAVALSRRFHATALCHLSDCAALVQPLSCSSVYGATFMPPHSCLHTHAALMQPHARCHIFSPLSRRSIVATAFTLPYLCSTSHTAAFKQHLSRRHISVAGFTLLLLRGRTFAVAFTQLPRNRSAVQRLLPRAHLPMLRMTTVGWNWEGTGGGLSGWAVFK